MYAGSLCNTLTSAPSQSGSTDIVRRLFVIGLFIAIGFE